MSHGSNVVEQLDAQLNPSQHAAVTHEGGPLLVLAGPGSGKTRVVTSRIAYLVRRGVPSNSLLALTFTNKAAAEMAHRVARLAGAPVWVSTFHRFCSRLLRLYASLVGLDERFTIYDAEDSLNLLKSVVEGGRIHTGRYSPRQLAQTISRAKNELMCPEDLAQSRRPLDQIVAELLPAYQQRLLGANAVDFDDLLLHVVRLLHENPELRSELDGRYQCILVDEYQDTNLAQYMIVRGLSIDYPNLTVTGDPDQSIYSWRGANIQNILRFERDYPGATVVRLEQNYRSSKRILEVADKLISANTQRKAKSLWTENDEGCPVQLVEYETGRAEAEGIVDTIAAEVDSGHAQPRDFAVLYRTNALSRSLEHAFRARGIPYQIVRGIEFYKRKEIKDILAYLQLIVNSRDDLAVMRVINAPPRGIGKITLQKLRRFTESHRVSALEAMRGSDFLAMLSPRLVKSIREFIINVDQLVKLSASSLEMIVNRTLDITKYREHLRETDNEEDRQRLANVEELCTAAREYDQTHDSQAGLEGFLEQAALVNETDDWADASDKVTLMSLHAAKGLEFPAVFVMAVEDGILPHERSREGLTQLEEERRILFVGVTRAKSKLQLSYARRRDYRGNSRSSIPSQFLVDLRFANVNFRIQDSPTWPARNELAEFAQERSQSESQEPDQAWNQDPPVLEPSSDYAIPSPGVGPSSGSPTTLRMITAAEMLAEVETTSEPRMAGGDQEDYQPGSFVLHPEFGIGTIVDVHGKGKRQTVAVRFGQSTKSRKFRTIYCPLKPIRPT